MVNLVEVLRYCPVGFSLYSPIFGNVTFLKIETEDILIVLDSQKCQRKFFKTGHLLDTGTCGEVMLWPSSDRRTWDGFKLFKKGDIIISSGGCIAIVDHIEKFDSLNNVIYCQCCFNHRGGFTVGVDVGVGRVSDCNYASIHDQECILRKLKEHGFELKGDTVVKKKFDPQTFEPFQKVLVRTLLTGQWRCTFFSHMMNGKAICSGDNWPYCIPYENNEHLRGKANDCDDFYKWWGK